jgi:integrase/recombinase XerC
MPVTADRASVASYAQFPAELDRDWLGRVCHLSGADLAVIRRRTDPVTQLGYATQLVTVRAIGTFQPDPAAVPKPVVAAVARQLGIDDFYTRCGLGPASAGRLDLPAQAPRALDAKTALRWIRAIAARTAPRDRVLALLPLYAGLRVSETVALDVDDVRLSARKGTLRVRGKRGKPRDLPIHAQLRTDLQAWLDERPDSDWPGVGTSPALLLNRRGQRLSVRGASNIIRAIAAEANLDEEHITAHVGRHTFATTLVRGGTDLVAVADMLGHARLDTVRLYTHPTAADRERALNLLPYDR